METNIKTIGNAAIFFHFIMFIFCIIITFSPNSIIGSGYGVSGYSFNFSASIITIVVTVVAVLIALALIGIQGLASGLNDTSTFQIMKIVTLSAMWSIISSVTFQYFLMIEVFGMMIYAILTVSFVIYMIGGSAES